MGTSTNDAGTLAAEAQGDSPEARFPGDLSTPNGAGPEGACR